MIYSSVIRGDGNNFQVWKYWATNARTLSISPNFSNTKTEPYQTKLYMRTTRGSKACAQTLILAAQSHIP